MSQWNGEPTLTASLRQVYVSSSDLLDMVPVGGRVGKLWQDKRGFGRLWSENALAIGR
jgi:hypothetical protein